jgi:hypothetical protein
VGVGGWGRGWGCGGEARHYWWKDCIEWEHSPTYLTKPRLLLTQHVNDNIIQAPREFDRMDMCGIKVF